MYYNFITCNKDLNQTTESLTTVKTTNLVEEKQEDS